MNQGTAIPFPIQGLSLDESKRCRRDLARVTIYFHIYYVSQGGQIVGRKVGNQKRLGVALRYKDTGAENFRRIGRTDRCELRDVIQHRYRCAQSDDGNSNHGLLVRILH